jgi:hypothetical protein
MNSVIENQGSFVFETRASRHAGRGILKAPYRHEVVGAMR